MDNEFKDCNKQLVDKGDVVAFAHYGSGNLYTGKVVGFSPKKIRICTKGGGEYVKFGEQVAVISKA